MSALRLMVLVLVVAALMEAARGTPVASDARLGSAALVLAIGFALVAAGFAGKLFAMLGLPRLTGYLAAGIVVGPHVLGYVHHETVQGLQLVNGVAVALIALTAGSEIHLASLRPLARIVGAITAIAVVGTAIALTLLMLLMRSFFPFYTDMDLATAVAVSSVLGVILASQSPAVVVAIRSETAADGPVARITLAVVVLADLVIVLLFAVCSSVTQAALSGNFDPGEAAGAVATEILGSLAIGLAIGMIIALYMRFVRQGLDIFSLTVCLVVAEVGRRVHMDPLLIMLAAGTFVENALGQGERLRASYDDASLPVYIVFFTVAGASIDLGALQAFAIPALAVVLVRALGFLGGNAAASRLARAPEQVVRYGGVGLLAQAGLANGLTAIIIREFPEFGPAAAPLVYGVIAINALVAPALFRLALIRSGEANDRASTAPAPAH